MVALSLIEITQDIHAMDEELWHYEKRYGLRSESFYELYKAGQLRDEDPVEIRDYVDWAACYEIKRHREELYDAQIREALQKLGPEQAGSLAELKLTQQPAVTPAGV